MRLIGSPGQRNDIAFAHELMEGLAAEVAIADKGYDADHLCDRITESGGQTVIPPKRNPTFKRPYATELYKQRTTIIDASSTSSNSSATSQPDTTSCSPTHGSSSKSPLS